ncbi:MAG: hypothetical protein HPY66_1740 [Firmicutes bacterium]|nr:hypothetical protein [Bacillota bacterium]
MPGQWSSSIHNHAKFWILRENDTSNNYVLMKKPANFPGNGQALEYFAATSQEDASTKGLELAKKHGLIS